MIVSASQPYFAPYPGFFMKALLSDVLVLLDSVQFPQGTTWLTRNRFKNDQGTLWLTVPVWKKGLGRQRILEVAICPEGRWRNKHPSSLQTAYQHAPFFEDHRNLVAALGDTSFERLLDLNVWIIRYVLEALEIPAKLVRLSELGIAVKEPELSVEVCRNLGASVFLAQQSAHKYLEPARFEKAGVALHFFNPRPLVYPQLWGDFLPNLSVLDLLFNCGPRAGPLLRQRLRRGSLSRPVEGRNPR